MLLLIILGGEMKKKSNLFCKLLFVLFLFFIVLYIALECGYYETKLQRKVILTNEKIESFEKAVKEGNVINLDSYLEKEEVDYSNSISSLGNKLTNVMSKTFINGLSEVFDIIKKLFW